MPFLDSPPESSMPLRLAIALVVLVAVFAAWTAPATARVTGPCLAEIATEDARSLFTGARDEAVPVDRNSLVPVRMTSERPMTRLKVELEFAGVRFTVHDRPTTGTSWASEVPVDDYAAYGLGLYKVIGSGTGLGIDCNGAALVEVQGDTDLAALATPIGLAGLALALIGALGALALALRVGQSRVSPIASGLLGAVFGLGVVILLQQFGVVYPTLLLTVGILAISGLVGFGIGLFGIAGSQADARSSPVR